MTGVLHAHLLSVSTAALRGKPSDTTPPPQIASLVSSDCQRFDNCSSMLHFGPLALVALLVVAGLLADLVGLLPMFAGVGVMLLVIGVQIRFSRRFAAVRKLTAGRTDGRARAASEAFGAMLSLKAYGWEGALQQRIVNLRREEAAGVLIAHKMRGINNGLYSLRDPTATPPVPSPPLGPHCDPTRALPSSGTPLRPHPCPPLLTTPCCCHVAGTLRRRRRRRSRSLRPTGCSTAAKSTRCVSTLRTRRSLCSTSCGCVWANVRSSPRRDWTWLDGT
jgi:hypothetical protein